MTRRPIIAVIDDNEAVRDSVASLIRSFDMTVLCYPSAGAFLGAEDWSEASCLVVDVRMPVMGGLVLYETLLTKGVRTPVIFMSAYSTDQALREAARLGATCILKKPLLSANMLPCIRKALQVA